MSWHYMSSCGNSLNGGHLYNRTCFIQLLSLKYAHRHLHYGTSSPYHKTPFSCSYQAYSVTFFDKNSTQLQVSKQFLHLFGFVSLFLVFLFHFLFIPCGRLSWLSVSFLLHVKYTLSYRICQFY